MSGMWKLKATICLVPMIAASACAPAVGQEALASAMPVHSAVDVLPTGQIPADNSLTLLGTGGGPFARTDRAGSATLLRVGGQNYLIDAGQGVVAQLAKAGLASQQIPLVFLTHLHDDHYAGLPGLASFSFTMRGPGLTLVGPPRTGELEAAIEATMNVSASIRIVENRISGTVEDFVSSQEVTEGEVYRDDNVRVTALVNQHFRIAADTEMGRANKSLGFAFEFGDRRVVFTGDTGPFGRLVEFAQGADVLVAEMASYADRAQVPPHIVPHMDYEHLSPTEVGRLAQRAGVEVLVLSHIGFVGEADIAEIRRNFSGELVVGEDMATFVLN